jgi:hypothetical protein
VTSSPGWLLPTGLSKSHPGAGNRLQDPHGIGPPAPPGCPATSPGHQPCPLRPVERHAPIDASSGDQNRHAVAGSKCSSQTRNHKAAFHTADPLLRFGSGLAYN